jgi:hypothetical protein
LRTLRRKAEAKLERFPGLVDREALARARTLYDFDDAVTGPLHGFRDAHDYYMRSSALRFLDGIRRPTLMLSSRDDPFLPEGVLDEVMHIARRNSYLYPEFSERGGHVGFVSGPPWRPSYYAEERAAEFLADHIGASRKPAEIEPVAYRP